MGRVTRNMRRSSHPCPCLDCGKKREDREGNNNFSSYEKSFPSAKVYRAKGGGEEEKEEEEEGL